MSIHASLTKEIDQAPDGPRICAFFDLGRTIIAGVSPFAFLANWILSGRMTRLSLVKTVLAAVPIVFRNTLDARPQHGIVFRPANVEVEVLKPVPTRDWTRDNVEERIAHVRQLYSATLGLV